MGARSVELDGEKLRRLRKAKGWTMDDLAKKAGCGERTVRVAESGKGVDAQTLSVLAGALGVKPEELMQKDEPVAEGAKEEKPTIIITINVAIPFEQFDTVLDTERVIQELRRLFAIKGEMRAVNIEKGSTIITLEIDEEDARLMEAILAIAKERPPSTAAHRVGEGSPTASTPPIPDILKAAELLADEGTESFITSVTISNVEHYI